MKMRVKSEEDLRKISNFHLDFDPYQYCGKEFEVERALDFGYGRYLLKGNPYCWHSDWLEPVEEKMDNECAFSEQLNEELEQKEKPEEKDMSRDWSEEYAEEMRERRIRIKEEKPEEKKTGMSEEDFYNLRIGQKIWDIRNSELLTINYLLNARTKRVGFEENHGDISWDEWCEYFSLTKPKETKTVEMYCSKDLLKFLGTESRGLYSLCDFKTEDHSEKITITYEI